MTENKIYRKATEILANTDLLKEVLRRAALICPEILQAALKDAGK